MPDFIIWVILLIKQSEEIGENHLSVLIELTELIEQTFNREAHFIWLVMIKMPFFTSEQPKGYKLWSCHIMLMRSIIFWTIYLYDLARNYIDKL